MSALAQAAEDYLRLRNSLGHDLAEAHRLLPRFIAYLDSVGVQTVTIDAALAWVYEAGVDPTSSNPARRMSIARGFARHRPGLAHPAQGARSPPHLRRPDAARLVSGWRGC